jgi:hypothetical protein
MEWKRSGIGKERARLKVGLWRRHGEERERSKCGEIGGGESESTQHSPSAVDYFKLTVLSECLRVSRESTKTELFK